MTGQIAAPSTISVELVAAIVDISMILGAIDLVRQPGWAWKRAEESKPAWFVLVALVPLVGLGMYLHTARPRVAAIAAAGRAASLPFDHFRNDTGFRNNTGTQRQALGGVGGVAPPERFATAGATMVRKGEIRMVEDGPNGHGSGGFRSEPTGAGGTAVRSATAPIGLIRTYRPTQRASLTVPSPSDVSRPAAASVPAGWKADPTGRHQFRYWGGTRWTDDVADHGEQSRDATTS